MLKKIKGFLFENQNSRQTVAKNTFWLSVSNFGGRIVKSGLIIYAARALGTVEYGVFSYAITLAGFFSLFMDPGINAVLLRDASAADEPKRRALFSTVAVIKLVLIFPGVAVIIFIAPLFSTLPGSKVLLPIVAIIMSFDTIREFLLSLVRAMERMEWETGIFLLTNLAILIFGFIFILHNPTAAALGWGYAVGTVVGACVALYVLRERLKNIAADFSRSLILPIFRDAWPFAVTGALGLLLTNTDILIISWMKTASDVGVYSAAIRIIQLLYLIPLILQFTTLPLLSRLANRDNEKFRQGFEHIMSVLLMIAIPMTLGSLILGTDIMTFVFGAAYAPGGLALKVLMFIMIIGYPAFALSNGIFAYNRQRYLIISAALGSGLNILFDIAFIPRWGMTGSAVGTLIATFISQGYLWRAMNATNPFSVLPHLKKVGLAAGGMTIVCLGLYLAHVNLIVNVLVCAVIYFALLKLLREPLLSEIWHLAV